ncbi:MAG TPA: copper homeostasis protein CutC [Acidobacteriaceae bacterium]|nr:copper homeostasis protein CutC [Acidobacteriaceae bacterium]
MILEICVDSVESAMAAERGGAQRVELCSDLLEGGITPSAGLISLVRRRISIDLFVMVRPRGGDFAYTREEFEAMREDIHQAQKLGADGIVLGVLDEHARVDVRRTRDLVGLARPLPVTYHRAVDMTADPETAIDDVLEAGAARVLTSGGAPSVMQGLANVAHMVRAARDRIAVMAGGGLTPQTLPRVAEATGATEFHASLRTASPSPVAFHRQGVHMGEIRDREYLRFTVHEENVRAMVKALQNVADRRAAARTG